MKFKMHAVIFILFGIFDFSSAQCSMTNVTVECLDFLGDGEAFKEPDQLDSSTNITLSVGIGDVTFGWLNLKRRMYNGKIAGPTVTVKPGDTLNLKLINTLSAEENVGKKPNTTNIHTHGLHISPQEPQDSMLVRVEPGETYNYVYQIHPQNPPGTNWYHAHVHGTVMFQVTSGLAGLLIVEDDVAEMPAELAAVSCPDNCDKDIQMLFQSSLYYTGYGNFGGLQDKLNDYEGFKNDQYILEQGETLAEFLKKNLNQYTTNGQIEPVLAMETGQMYRFRMANAGGIITLELQISNESGQPTNSCTIREIAVDGVYLDSPRELHKGQSLFFPATRIDWMVKCNTAGRYYLKSHPYPVHRASVGNIGRYEGNMVVLDVSGNEVSTVQNFPTTLPARPDYIDDLRSKTQSEIEGRFVVEFTPLDHMNRQKFSFPLNYRYKMEVGTLQEWHILNADANYTHPLHIHVNHFQVISYNEYTGGYAIHGKNWPLRDVRDRSKCLYQYEDYVESDGARKRRSEPDIVDQAVLEPTIDFRGDPLQYLGHELRYEADGENTLGYARLGEWRDTISVPPLSNITIRFIAHEHVGDIMMHCHILMDEDNGMMMAVEIVPEGESTDANITSGNAYPGSCRACDRYPFNNPETIGACESTSNVTTEAPSATTTSGCQKIHYFSNTINIVLLTVFFAFQQHY